MGPIGSILISNRKSAGQGRSEVKSRISFKSLRLDREPSDRLGCSFDFDFKTLAIDSQALIATIRHIDVVKHY